MKKIFSKLLVLGSLTLFAASCIGDNGNYEYKDGATIMPVIIGSMSSRDIVYGDRVTIEPTLIDDDARYSYKWFTYPTLANAGSNDAIDIRYKKLISESDDSPVLDIFIASQANPEFPDVPFVNLTPGPHRLCLEVWDENRDLYKRSAFDLNVSGTEMQRGLYILKDLAEGGVEIDYLGTSATFSGGDFEPIPYDTNLGDDTPGVWAIIPNVIQMQGEAPLPGTAVQIAYNRQRYPSMQTAPIEPRSGGMALFILSSEDARVINPLTMKSMIWVNQGRPDDDPDKRVPFDNLEDIMFVAPSAIRPQSIAVHQQIYATSLMMGTALLMVNDGKLHLYGGYAGVNDYFGKFLPPLALRDVNAQGTVYTSDYDLHSDFFMRTGNNMGWQTAVFDKKTRSVHYIEPWDMMQSGGIRNLFNNLGSALVGTANIPADPGQDFVSLVKMDYDMICMMPQDFGAQGRVFMLFKHITTGKHVLLRGAVTGLGHPLAGADASLFYVPDNSLMLTAKARMATPFVGNFVFFGNGEKLGVYRHEANASESILKEFPGEDIAWLGLWPMSNSAGSGALTHSNGAPKLIVLSNDDAGNYHVRIFNFNFNAVPTDPGIEPDPILEMTGVGKAHDAVIRFAS